VNVYRRIDRRDDFRGGEDRGPRPPGGDRPARCRIVIRRRYLKLLNRAGVSTWDELTDATRGATVARSASSSTRRISIDARTSIYIKTYRYSWRVVLKGLIRHTFLGRSRARREWDALVGQRRRRLPTIEPVAYAELRTFRCLRACALVTLGRNSWRPAEDAFDQAARRSDRSDRIRAVGRWLAKAHAAGFSDGNARLRNLLFDDRWSGSDLGLRLRNLDSPRGRFHSGPPPVRRRLRDLETLDQDARSRGWSKTDRARLLVAYLGGPLRDRTSSPMRTAMVRRLSAR